jgi:uncharacterized membrane protein YsdA (DUF1294 family)
MPSGPQALALAALAFNIVTIGMYAWDKWRASRNAWRVPERTLITLALLGGWPGAYLAMKLLRHKTSKPPFRRRVLAATLVNIALIAGGAYLAWRA